MEKNLQKAIREFQLYQKNNKVNLSADTVGVAMEGLKMLVFLDMGYSLSCDKNKCICKAECNEVDSQHCLSTILSNS